MASTTTREKLMRQIMERKRRTVEAVKQQIQEFDHYLSSLCILRGLPPPSLPSSQLNKEELISEVLLPGPYTNPYTGGQNSFHQMLVPDALFRGVEDSSFRDVSALNRGVAASDRLSVSPQLPAAECALYEFAGAGGAAASPWECRDVLVPDSHSKSLVRIERSKSRQQALKLRNSTKAAKTCSLDLQDVRGSHGQILEARTDSLQHDHPSDLRLVKSVSTSDRICTGNDENIAGGTLAKEQFGDERSATSQSSDKMNDSQDGAGNSSDLPYISKEEGDREMTYRLKYLSGCADALCETVNHSSVAAGASSPAEDITGGNCNKKSSNVNSGLPMRSFGLPSGGEKVSLDMEYVWSGDKDFMRPRFSTHESSQQPDNVNQPERWAIPSRIVPSGSNGARMMTRDISIEGGDVFPEIITRSRSSSQQSDITREHSKLDTSCSYDKEEYIDNVKHLSHNGGDSRNKSRSGDFNRSCRLGVRTSVFQGSKGRNTSYENGLERPNSFHQQHSSAGASLMENGSRCVSLEANARELWQAPSQSLVRGKDGYQEALVSDSKVSLQFDSRNIVESENCDAIQAVTKRDSERSVQNGVTSGTNLTGPCLGVEMIDTKSTTNSVVLVNPKELNFDDEEEPTLTEMGDSIVNNSQDKPNLWIEDALLEQKQLSGETHKEAKESSENEVGNCAISLEPGTGKADQLDTYSCISKYQNAAGHSLDSLHQCTQIKITNSNEPQSGSPILKTNQCQLIRRDPVVDPNRLDHGKGLVKCENQNDEQPMLEPELLSPAEQLEQVGPHQEIMEQNASNASILIHDEVAECPVLSSVLPSSKVSQVWLEKGEMTDSSGIIFSDRGLSVEKESSELHQHTDRLSLPTMELLTFVDKSVHGWKSDLLEAKNMECGSSYSPHCEPTKGISPDQNMPEFEGFVLETNEAQEHISLDGIDFNNLDLPSNVLERASVLERLCKSACMNTPISDFSSTYKLHHEQKPYQSLPNNVLGGMQLRNTLGMCVPREEIDADNSSLTKEINCNSHEVALPELQLSSAFQYAQETKKPYMSPVRKVWDGIIMKSGSSGKRASSATDLPCISEENESDEAFDTFEEGHALDMANVLVKRDPLAVITADSNLPTSVCENELPYDRCSVASINIDPKSCSKANLRPQNYSNKGRLAQTEKENQIASMRLSGIKRANNSLQQRVTKAKLSEKTGLRGARSTLEESKPSNIVSNVTSFIPLVQKRQAQPVVAGKREVKVKALEAAEAAKRLAEKKEIERRMKKEALKLDKEKKGEERRKNEAVMAAKRQREEEERRKHEADMAARKRQRGEDERKEKERKRQREEEERKDKERKRKRVEKPKKQDARTSEQKRPEEEPRLRAKIGKVKGDKTLDKVPEYQLANTITFADATSKASTTVTEKKHLNDYGDNSQVSSDHYEATKINRSTPDINREPSYEISPYKCSDDEDDDDEDDKPNYKFVPAWASRSAVALILSSQKKIDPETVFPPGSFCNIDEVLMPRRLQKNTRRSRQSNAVPR